MLRPPFSIVQDIFRTLHPPIGVASCPLANLTHKMLQDFLDIAEDAILGVAPVYGPEFRLAEWEADNGQLEGIRDALQELLLSAARPKFAFQMDVLSTSRVDVIPKALQKSSSVADKPFFHAIFWPCIADTSSAPESTVSSVDEPQAERLETEEGEDLFDSGTLGSTTPFLARTTVPSHAVVPVPVLVPVLLPPSNFGPLSHPFAPLLLLRDGFRSCSRTVGTLLAAPVIFPISLNNSQSMAVDAILSAKPIIVIHGLPGTGKMSIIAAAINSMRAPPADDRTVWRIAQSNVTVKNIAEKLASFCVNFKLIVSKDFHYDWHEHLYEQISPSVLRSDQLATDPVTAGMQLMGSKTVIVDEASQIDIGNFLPMISLFSDSLRKLMFIGDDKQLGPYGQADVSSLQSVFEMGHLRKDAIFLDTQYRRYADATWSIHQQAYFSGSKEIKKGSSWMNFAEVKAVVCEARNYRMRGSKSYTIITPYDAQRESIEAELKRNNLSWENRVFCVDSFQGNEDDFIFGFSSGRKI
ncbi:Regulator of nonsense transcripts 1 [Mycena venus]|uniref:Regulator of nonsense transcripts 1 n=1 Tax=Mycena venus TaxID=2733690 RepID=A0A8H6X928_9AGAR|nr:Regulator of nonsense transcripts 1 [Mycena venus]